MSGAILLLALAFERLRGDPATPRHPVAWFGRYAALIEQMMHADHRSAGVMAWLAAVLPPLLGLAWLHWALWEIRPWSGILFDGLVLWTTLGWRSLLAHVRAVTEATDLTSARVAVGQIVGRDTEALDESGIQRAALESLAENGSDAVIAPLFWFVVAGPLGAAAYRMINTLDAMWGHRSARYRHFGSAAARIDDVANWIPARLSAGLILLAARHPMGWSRLRPQAALHPSPNAGWPETALAWMLQVRLGGPVARKGRCEERPWLGPEEGRDPTACDTLNGIALLHRALLLGAGLMLGAVVLLELLR